MSEKQGDPSSDPDARTRAWRSGAACISGSAKSLAVANVEEGMHLIAPRITNPRLVGEVRWKSFPVVWGITALPVEFDPASSGAHPVGKSRTRLT